MAVGSVNNGAPIKQWPQGVIPQIAVNKKLVVTGEDGSLVDLSYPMLGPLRSNGTRTLVAVDLTGEHPYANCVVFPDIINNPESYAYIQADNDYFHGSYIWGYIVQARYMDGFYTIMYNIHFDNPPDPPFFGRAGSMLCYTTSDPSISGWHLSSSIPYKWRTKYLIGRTDSFICYLHGKDSEDDPGDSEDFRTATFEEALGYSPAPRAASLSNVACSAACGNNIFVVACFNENYVHIARNINSFSNSALPGCSSTSLSVRFTNGRFIVVGSNNSTTRTNQIWTSIDGYTWTQGRIQAPIAYGELTAPASDLGSQLREVYFIKYKGVFYTTSHEDNALLYSKDCINWLAIEAVAIPILDKEIQALGVYMDQLVQSQDTEETNQKHVLVTKSEFEDNDFFSVNVYD